MFIDYFGGNAETRQRLLQLGPRLLTVIALATFLLLSRVEQGRCGDC